MTEYTPIECGLYDHIELACLFRYRVRIELTDGTMKTGTATGTRTDADKQEWLLLDDGGQQIRLDNLRLMEALTEGARFSKVEFQRS